MFMPRQHYLWVNNRQYLFDTNETQVGQKVGHRMPALNCALYEKGIFMYVSIIQNQFHIFLATYNS